MLAERLGKTLQEIRESMDSDEFTKWRAFDDLTDKLRKKHRPKES